VAAEIRSRLYRSRNRRTIFEHTFSDFQLFSVQLPQVIEKPEELKDPKEKP
jgi:hypothetical protein